jgi:hypothetical protein
VPLLDLPGEEEGVTDPIAKRLSGLQLRIRAERLQLADLERFTSFDSDIDRLVQEARVKLELAEEWAALKMGRKAA